MLKNTAISLFLLFVLFVNAQDKENEFGNVTIEELEEEFYPLDSTAHAAYLYKEETLRYLYTVGGWAHQTTVYEKIKIYDKEGFDWATKKIFLYNSEGGSKEKVSKIEAYTYFVEDSKVKKVKLDKKSIFQEDKGKQWFLKKFTMPSLKKGVIVEWKYKVTSPFALHIDRLVLQEGIPVKRYSTVLTIPEYFVFKLYKRGVIPIEISKFSRGMRGLKGQENFYIIEANNIPAFKKEAYISNKNNFISSVDFDLSHVEYPDSERKYHAMGTWEEVIKRIFKSYEYEKNLKKEKYFKEDLLALELEGKSDKDKIAVVLEHVKSKIKWNKSFRKGVSTDLGVKKAYTIGEGNAIDVNLVLTAMLKKAGFKASPVMVSTKAHGVSLFPSIKAYNYVIVAVEGVDESPILLDATEEFSYLNVLPFRTINWFGRLIREDLTSEEVYLNPKVYALEKQQMNVEIQENLSVKGILKTVYTTHNALKYRKKTNHLDDPAHKKMVKEKYNIGVESIKTVSKNDLKNPYVRFIEFNDSQAIEKINDKLYVEPFFFLKRKINPFKLEKRDYPVDFGFPWKDDYSIMIKIPEGYKVEYLPLGGDFKIKDNIGSYSYQIAEDGNMIRVSFSIQFNSSVIVPKYYKELKGLYKDLITKQAEKIVLIKKE